MLTKKLTFDLHSFHNFLFLVCCLYRSLTKVNEWFNNVKSTEIPSTQFVTTENFGLRINSMPEFQQFVDGILDAKNQLSQTSFINPSSRATQTNTVFIIPPLGEG